MRQTKRNADRRRIAAVLRAAALAALAAGCDSGIHVDGPKFSVPTAPLPPATPAGAMATETRPIAGVKAVSLRAVGYVDIALGQAESLTITAPERVMPLLTSEVVGGRLDLDRASPGYQGQASDIQYEIGLRRLDELMLEGVGQIHARGIAGDAFSARLGGVGDVTAAGRVRRQEVRVGGLGTYHGAALESQITEVHLSSGSAEIWATDRVGGWVGFGATLEVWGGAEVSIQGQGKVLRRGAKL